MAGVVSLDTHVDGRIAGYQLQARAYIEEASDGVVSSLNRDIADYIASLHWVSSSTSRRRWKVTTRLEADGMVGINRERLDAHARIYVVGEPWKLGLNRRA